MRLRELKADIVELEEMILDAKKDLNVSIKHYTEMIKDLKHLKEIKSTLVYSN